MLFIEEIYFIRLFLFRVIEIGSVFCKRSHYSLTAGKKSQKKYGEINMIYLEKGKKNSLIRTRNRNSQMMLFTSKET